MLILVIKLKNKNTNVMSTCWNYDAIKIVYTCLEQGNDNKCDHKICC